MSSEQFLPMFRKPVFHEKIAKKESNRIDLISNFNSTRFALLCFVLLPVPLSAELRQVSARAHIKTKEDMDPKNKN